MVIERPSALEQYCDDVLSGKIVACRRLKQLCERLKREVHEPYKQWHFDQAKAEKAVEFIERFCKIPSGRLGQPMILEPYEKALVESVFGFVDDKGMRRYQEVLVLWARKNGKTSLVAAIELYMLVADGEGSPQVYNVATNLDQASLAYNACVKMVKMSGEISRHVAKRAEDLFCDVNFGYIKPLASNSNTLDGLDVHCGVLDEIHAMKDRDLYDLVKQGMAARDQPLLFQITTNGFIRNGLFDNQLQYAYDWLDGKLLEDDDRFLAWIYELDDRDEWEDEDCWMKANPGLGTVKKWEYLRNNVKKAKSDPSFRATVMTKDFNMPENTSVAWLTFDEAVNDMKVDFGEMGFKYGICGFDASDTIDLTCAQMLMMRPGDDHIYERSMYWIPEDTILADMESGSRKERDGVPYQQWIARGLLRTVPGNKIDKRVIIDWLIELRDEEDIFPFAIGFDPWHVDDSCRREMEMFVGKSRCIPVRQGAITLSQPMKQIKSDYAANRIVDNAHPINSWCRMNVSVRGDVNGNIQPDKKKNDPRNRIDGFAAEIDAYTVLCNLMDDYQQMIAD